MYKGIGASAGIGIGKIVKIKEEELNYTKQSIEDTEAEKKRLSDAIEVFIEKTQKMVESMKVTAGEQEAEILEGHIMMIQDPAISEQIEAKIDGEKINAEAAVEEACDFFAQIFAMADDELTQQRASDLGDIKTRLIKILLGIEEVDISAVPEGTILVAEDLTPSMTAGINPANVQGVLTEIGGKTSHSAIICRSMEIPAVLSIENIVSIVNDGDEVVLDGSTGEAFINPEASVVEEYKAKKAKFLEEKAALQKFVGQKSQTADGHVVELVANIGGPDEAEGVLERDGEGVGLFRSEFLFMESDAIPSEEAQFEGTILVAEDLTPSMTAGINPANVQGVLTEIGGKTSHSAIICRSMEIPAVLSIENIVSIVNDGDEVVLDGSTGEAFINPEASVVEEYKAKKAKFLEEKAALQKFVGQKSQTADGHVVELVANIGGPDEAEGVLERDGEGVGLFRSEFLFMESDAIPSEEAQFEAYKKVAETLDGKPVIIRTLDIGGDKALPYLGLPTEENPFLGFRAVRFCLQRKEDIYKPQLRALLRASAFGKVRIMVPLVTCVDELRAVKAIIEELKQELDAEGIAYDKDIQVGVMMETAAASLIADILAKEADFFSIGTNDLTGYTMAADRGNPDVAYLYSAYNPAVLRSIRNIISAANKEDIMAGMCGEAASDPLLVPVLLGFGLNEFSVSATAILATRKVMSLWTMDECKALVDEVMQLETEAEVKALLEERARS